jgi:type I restriction enzyme S subunit
MSERKEYKLSSLMDIIGGGTPKTSIKEYWDGNIPWLSVVDFNTGRKFVTDTEKKITELGLKESSTKYLEAGDIIISARGTVGALAVLEKPMTFNQSCYGLKAKKGVTKNSFLYYLIKDTISEFSNHTYGAVFDTITKESFDNILILLPTLIEQERIAEILSSLDDKIELLHKQNYTLEQLADTLFRQWFIEDVDIQKSMKLKDYVDSANTGLDAIKRAPIVEKETGIKCLRIQDVSQSKPFYKWGNSDVEENNYKRFKLIKGDIIMARTCSPGINYFVREDLVSVFNNGLIRIRANKNKVHPIFLYQLFKTRDFIGHVDSVSGGTSVQLNMQIGDLLDYDFTFINKSKQDHFVSYFLSIDEKILYNLKQIQQLETLRDTLLPKLMTGSVKIEK